MDDPQPSTSTADNNLQSTPMIEDDEELDKEMADLVNAEEYIEKKGVGMLEFEKQMFLDMLYSDGLCVCAHGISYSRILANLLKVYCDPANLILVINSNDYEEKLLKQMINSPLVFESSTNATERERVYLRGGIQFVSTRILVVDLLKKRIPIELITGIFVLRAHTVIESCQEAFALRLYRQSNKTGFVKAFSNNVEAFTFGYGHVEKVMRNLFITELLIWPRFHATIQKSLKPFEPQVIEFHIPMSDKMTMIQTCLLDLMNFIVKEIKRLNRYADLEELTVENCVTKQFNRILQAQLDGIWYRLGAQTKLLVSDLKILRNLLHFTIYSDAVALYALVKQYRTSEYAKNNSGWILLDSADQMFTLAKDRVFNKKGEFEPEHCQKWKPLSEILKVEIPCDIRDGIKKMKKEQQMLAVKQPKNVLILCQDARTCYQINEYLTQGGEKYLFHSAIVHRVTVGQLSEPYRRIQRMATVEIQPQPQRPQPKPANVTAPVNESFGGSFLKNHLVNKKKRERKKDLDKTEPEKTEIEQFLTNNEPVDEEEVHYRNSYVLTMTQRGAAVDNDYVIDESFDATQAPDLQFESFTEGDKDDFDITHLVTAASKPLVFIQTFRNERNGMQTLDQVLEELRPNYIIMYHMNMSAIRHIEVYEARLQREHDKRLKVYFLLHAKTVEEQAYLTLLRREKQAFELLIHTKQRMVIPKYQDGRSDDILALIEKEAMEEVAANAVSRKAGGQEASAKRVPPKVIVDMREFRSDLPCLIHKRGIEVVPLTITIGDYILTPEICVERKSISDLIGSLNSGRLYNQCVQMTRYYAKPILLIEFDQNKPFHLQRYFMTSSETTGNFDIFQKLILLTLHFPKLKLVWSPSPYATAQLFEELKLNKDEPDSDKAIVVGTDDGANDLDLITEKYNANIYDFLIRLPGISTRNIGQVLKKVKNLKMLSKMTEVELTELLGNSADAKLLWNSFHVEFQKPKADDGRDKAQSKFKRGFGKKFAA